MSITTVAKCKAFRGIGSENTEHDAELERIIPAVQAFLEQECARAFEQATVTEYHNGMDYWSDADWWLNYSYRRGKNRIMVKRPPITSITSLYDDPSRVFGSTTLIAPSYYAVTDDEAGFVQLDGLTFRNGLRNIKITYVGGYPTIPLDLEQAAIEMVWAAREKGLHNLIGVRSRSIADGNIQFVNLDWGSVNLNPIIQKYSLKTGVA